VKPYLKIDLLVKVGEMTETNNMFRIVTGLLFTAGVIDFMSGEFIFSTMLFGLASLGFIGK